MKLSQYIKKLQAIEKKYPDINVVFAADEEGNSFHELTFTPSVGDFNGSDFINDDGTEEFTNNYEINAVCLN